MARFLLKVFFAALALIAFTFSQDISVSAANYGEGTYGSGVYNVGEVTATPTSTTSTSSSSSSGVPICNDTKPGSAPWLYAASSRGAGSILLQFTESLDPVSEYVVEYGTEANKYPFAMANIGGKGTTSYLVQSLTPSTTYYFRVRAGNGCATGDWSNEISAKTKDRFSFFTRPDELETEIVDTQITEKEIEQKTYTVKAGDSLYTIALELLGDVNRYKEIIELNIDKYPSLETNPSAIQVGWELLLPSGDGKKESDEPEEEQEEASELTVKIKVIDEGKNPVDGANVTLHSTPRDVVTNNEGIARFEDVEPGEHRVVIAYNNQIGEQMINVQDNPDVKEVDFTIQLKSTSPFKEPAVMLVIGGLSLATIVAVTMLIRRKT